MIEDIKLFKDPVEEYSKSDNKNQHFIMYEGIYEEKYPFSILDFYNTDIDPIIKWQEHPSFFPPVNVESIQDNIRSIYKALKDGE